MNIKLEKEIKDEDIVDALITALEGGSNYWYFLPDVDMVKSYPDKSLSEAIILNVLEDETIAVPVIDLDDEEDLLGYISKQNIMEGLELFISNGNQFDPAMDAEEADILFQYVVMKDIIFG